MNMRNDTLEKCLSEWNIGYTPEQLSKLERFYELLTDMNKKMNLTAITDYDEVMLKHFADSLSVLRFLDIGPEEKVLDLGTGGGFPGIPLKIFLPDNEFLLVDSVNKKLSFVSSVIDDLGLQNISVLHGRAEDLASDDPFREKFDLVLSRAVANLSTLSELSLGFVKFGGMFVSYKGLSGREELSAAEKSVAVMGGRCSRVGEYELPGGDRRSLIFVEKISSTPKGYPRKAGVPAKKPL